MCQRHLMMMMWEINSLDFEAVISIMHIRSVDAYSTGSDLKFRSSETLQEWVRPLLFLLKTLMSPVSESHHHTHQPYSPKQMLFIQTFWSFHLHDLAFSCLQFQCFHKPSRAHSMTFKLTFNSNKHLSSIITPFLLNHTVWRWFTWESIL